MIPHLLFLWCLGTDPNVVCSQSRAYRIVDIGPAPQSDNCATVLERWLLREEPVSVGDHETLMIACEAPVGVTPER